MMLCIMLRKTSSTSHFITQISVLARGIICQALGGIRISNSRQEFISVVRSYRRSSFFASSRGLVHTTVSRELNSLIKQTFKLHSDLTNRLLSQTNSTRPRPGLVSFISPPRGPRLQSFSPSSPRDALLTRASSTSLDFYVYLYFLCQSLRSCVKLRRRSRSISALQRRTKHRVAAHASLTTFRDSRTWTLTSPTTEA